MKKLLVLLICLCTILSACSSTSSDKPSDDGVKLPTAKPNEELADYNLQLTTRFSGAFDLVTCDTGAYFALTGNVIGYVDQASGESAALCNRLECEHDDDTCTAYIKGPAFSLFTNAKQSKLFAYYYTDEQTSNYPAQYIQMMDLNGENRKEIFCINNGGKISIEFVFDNDDMYFITETFDKETRKPIYSLIKVNCITGEATTIQILESRFRIVGAFDQYILLDNNDNPSMGTGHIYKYDLVSKENISVIEYEIASQQATKIPFPHKEFLYIFEPTGETTAQVSRWNLKTDEKEIVANNVTYFGTHSIKYFGALILEDTIFIESSLPPLGESLVRRAKLVAVDLNSGEENVITLKANTGEPIVIAGAMSQQYIFHNGFKDRFIPVRKSDGTMAMMEMSVADYKMIAKNDCLNNINSSTDFM